MDGYINTVVSRDYDFMVYPSDLKPYGVVGKENLDVIRLTFDFTCYLEEFEILQQVQFPTIAVAPPGTTPSSWRSDYPLDCSPAGTLPTDDYPLRVVSLAITHVGKAIELRLNAGTPGFTYVASFLITASTTRRRKQVDSLIRVESLLNPTMISPGDLDPDIVPPIIIGGSTALPIGFDGLVILQNTSNNSTIVITFPPNPTLGQMVEFIDAYGTDRQYPVTFRGDGDVPIDGDGRTVFVSSMNYDCLRWKWTGANWHLMQLRFGFIGGRT
jgi:hypothetical protein